MLCFQLGLVPSHPSNSRFREADRLQWRKQIHEPGSDRPTHNSQGSGSKELKPSMAQAELCQLVSSLNFRCKLFPSFREESFPLAWDLRLPPKMCLCAHMHELVLGVRNYKHLPACCCPGGCARWPGIHFLKKDKTSFPVYLSRKKMLKIQITLLCGSQCCWSQLFLSPPTHSGRPSQSPLRPS